MFGCYECGADLDAEEDVYYLCIICEVPICETCVVHVDGTYCVECSRRAIPNRALMECGS